MILYDEISEYLGGIPLKDSDIINQIICADVLDGLRAVPDESVHLMFCSPPYTLDIPYGSKDDNMPWAKYLDWLFEVWSEVARTLVSGGRMVIKIDSVTNRQDPLESREYIRPIVAELVMQMRRIPGMMYRSEFSWYKHQVVGRATAWGSYMSCSNPTVRRNHEHVLVWSKDSWKLPGDQELSDMTDEEFQQWTMSHWYINAETRKMGGHPVPFPEELARRVIKLYSYRGNTVLDPFVGSGTTCMVAAANARNFIGIDNHRPYAEYASRRIAREKAVAIEDNYVPRSQRMKNSKQLKSKYKLAREPQIDCG